MSNKQDLKIDSAKIAKFFQDALTKIKTEENPDVLNEYKKLFKKNVPLNMRGYVSAYLTMKMTSSERNASARYKKSYKNENSSSFDSRRKPKTPLFVDIDEKAPLPEVPKDEAASLFFNVGKSRHVFRKDIVGMITNVCNLSRERIGSIKILDNYSFVTVYKEDADNIIKALDEYPYRGKQLTVNYSLKKSEMFEASETDSEETSENENDSSDIDENPTD